MQFIKQVQAPASYLTISKRTVNTAPDFVDIAPRVTNRVDLHLKDCVVLVTDLHAIHLLHRVQTYLSLQSEELEFRFSDGGGNVK